MSIAVRITDEGSPLLARIRTAADASGLAMVGARAVAGELREHFLRLDAARHRPGRGDGFYGNAARSVQPPARDGLGAVVNFGQRGVRLRRLGGIIRPKAGKQYVAYPADDAPRAALENGPRSFFDLDLQRVINPAHGGLQLALVRRASTPISLVRRKRKDGTVVTRVRAGAQLGGEVVFWLARKTTHRADASVLPTDAKMQTLSLEGIRTHLLNQAQRAALPPSA